MSNGYYIYLDRRDVGKDNLNFSGWVNYNDGKPTDEQRKTVPWDD